MKEKTPTVASPGSEMGTRMLKRVLSLEQPSISAASSISFGMVLKKLLIIHTENISWNDR
jgi:hypothetical protein